MPDIKERLLQIVSHTDPMDAMDELLENLRCDRCKNWRSTGATNWRTHKPTGDCFSLDRITHADFFCATWEARSA